MKITLTDPILRFSQETEKPCVSIYYPTHRNGPETRQDPIRLKNLMRLASERLGELGHEDKAESILRPISNLLPDIDFWVHQQEGLALFASPNQFRYFHLPYPVPELAVASTDFYLKPLLPLFSRDEQFFILALGKNHVRLYEANRYSIHQVEVPTLPESIFEALQHEEGKPTLQHHSFGPTVGSKGPGNTEQGGAMFHGQGSEKDVKNDELLRYFRAVSKGLQHHVRDSRLPLVLACVERYLPIYREVNLYPHLIKEGVCNGVEALPEKELREKAWAVVEPYLAEPQRKVLERFQRIAYNGNGSQNAAREIEAAVRAAYEGRIDTLVLPREQEVWGEFDESTEEVKREASEPSRRTELFDFAAMQTLRHGGELFLVSKEKMPPDAEVAALLRYSGGIIERET